MTRLVKIAALLTVFAPLAAQAAPATSAHAKLMAAMDRAYNLSFPVPQPHQIATAQKVQATPVHAQHKG
jgi:hypothetical protein